jgi:class 3 adenylate cyclase/CheY-like chemotaxis protein
LTILCVDDERIILSGLKEQLRRGLEGVTIETAETGDEGLEVFRELRAEGTHVPLVISDQLMPGMRGEELLAAVHAIDPDTLNVLLTGQATADAVGAAVNKARLYRYIGKPWTEHDLVTTSREALRAWAQARAIKVKERELVAAHESSVRFVPREFLGLLGRERLVDVRFGDHVEREMSILFTDMRDYTSLVEGRTTSEAFRMVNEHMTMLDDALREHGGFIGNIEGDAVLALFAGSADAAVRAGIHAFGKLREQNLRRASTGDPRVAMGVAVNSGPLLLGTIGGKDRLQCDVIGDPVNVCARIESLTKLYDTSMLVSHTTVERLRERPSLREVDRVRVKGKRTPITLYEVLDALEDDGAKAKRATASSFAEAIESFRAGRFEAALGLFDRVLGEDPRDGAALLYQRRCQRFLREGSPEGFDGTTNLRSKDGEA